MKKLICAAMATLAIASSAQAEFALDVSGIDAVRGLGDTPFLDLAINETALMWKPECVKDGRLFIDASHRIEEADAWTNRMRVTLNPGRTVSIVIREEDERPRIPEEKYSPLISMIRSLSPHHVPVCQDRQSDTLIPVSTINGYGNLSDLLNRYKDLTLSSP